MSDARDANHQPGDLSSHQPRLRDFIHPFSEINVDSDQVIHRPPSINQSTYGNHDARPDKFLPPRPPGPRLLHSGENDNGEF